MCARNTRGAGKGKTPAKPIAVFGKNRRGRAIDLLVAV